jgi:hypothetical protein
MILRGKR